MLWCNSKGNPLPSLYVLRNLRTAPNYRIKYVALFTYPMKVQLDSLDGVAENFYPMAQGSNSASYKSKLKVKRG